MIVAVARLAVGKRSELDLSARSYHEALDRDDLGNVVTYAKRLPRNCATYAKREPTAIGRGVCDSALLMFTYQQVTPTAQAHVVAGSR